MTIEVINPSDRRFVKALIFGPSGQGKTHLLGTAQADERTSPMLLLDFEGGHETLAGLEIDVIEIRSWNDYSEAYELLSSNGHPYKSVGIDSVSETHVWALLTILKEQAPRREGSSHRDPDQLEQADYGKASTQLRRLLREFRDLPMHVFYTATAKEVEERGAGRIMKPALAGQMADDVVALMSVSGYLAIAEDDEGDTQRELVLHSEPKFRTKVRVPWDQEAPETLPDPSIAMLMDALDIPKTKKRTRKKED